MLADPILTERLVLLAVTSALMHAEVSHTTLLANLLQAEVPLAWPPEHREPHVFAFIQKQYDEAPHTLGWHRYIVLRGVRPVLIGTVDAHPRTPRGAEIGYSLLAAWQHAGLATEATKAFVAALFLDGALQTISAQSFPHLTASTRLLTRCGFLFVGTGDEPGTVRYCLERNAHAG